MAGWKKEKKTGRKRVMVTHGIVSRRSSPPVLNRQHHYTMDYWISVDVPSSFFRLLSPRISLKSCAVMKEKTSLNETEKSDIKEPRVIVPGKSKPAHTSFARVYVSCC